MLRCCVCVCGAAYLQKVQEFECVPRFDTDQALFVTEICKSVSAQKRNLKTDTENGSIAGDVLPRCTKENLRKKTRAISGIKNIQYFDKQKKKCLR